MTEHAPSVELNFDEWLATGNRSSHYVNLYGRVDLMAEVEKLEAQRVPSEAPAEGSLSGEEDPNEALDEQINDLYRRIDESKRVFRVTALTQKEIEEIRERVLKECSDEIDDASRRGQAEAKKTAKRMEITVPGDINALVRIGVKEWTDKVIGRESTLRMIAQATMVSVGDDWVQLTLDQARNLYDKLGEAQTGLLADASYKANNEAPKVSIPK